MHGLNRLLVALAATLLACSTTACDVTVATEVDAHRDGTGTVRAGVGLDDDAMAKAGDLAAKLRVDDLRQSGWSVVGPRKEDDGRTWVRASKAFSSPEQGNRIMAELSGPQGPFRDLQLSQSQSFFHTRTSFRGAVDLSQGLTAFVDPELQERLGGGIGFDLEALKRRFGDALGQVFRMQIGTRLPGSVQSTSGRNQGGTVTWIVEPGQQVQMEAQAETLNLVPWLPAIGALLAVAVAVALVLWRRR